MNTSLGNILYAAGLIGAVVCLFFAVDAVWVHEGGGSLLPITGRFMSREDMLSAIVIGVALALLSVGAGSVARHYVNKAAAKKQADPDHK